MDLSTRVIIVSKNLETVDGENIYMTAAASKGNVFLCWH